MTFLLRHIAIVIGLALLPGGSHAAGDWQQDRFAKARLVLERVEAQTAHIGLEIKLDDGWHTYWRAPGDAGLPPQFDWSESNGIDADNVTISWPWPQEFQDFDYQTFGYEDHVILPISVPLTSEGGQITLNLSYAVCDEVCVPLNAQLTLSLDDVAPAALANLADWRASVPDHAHSMEASVHYDGTALKIFVPGGQGRAMLADTEDGRIFYAPALDEDGHAAFTFKPSALNPDPTGQMIHVAVMGADGVGSVETQQTVLKQGPPKQDPK